jgi:pantothenate kinase
MKEKRTAINHKDKEIYVLKQDEEVVGFMIFTDIRKNRICFTMIDYIATAGGNCGFGSRLIEELT